MLETTLLNPQNRKVPTNIFDYNKAAKISVGDGTVNQQTQAKDHVSLHDDTHPPLTYSSSMTINGDEGAKYRLLQEMVASLLGEQFISTEVVIEDKQINITELPQKEVEKLIADEGYFGVEQTSERIFQLATGFAGGDPSRVDAVREGVAKGFQEALDAFNGWLPDISYKTYDAVMTKLDNWAEKT